MAKTAADQVADMMIDAGIQRVYGVVGDSINPIVDAIRRSDGKLRWMHVRNEEVGAFAAGADALLTGQIAACAGSCGPGNLHPDSRALQFASEQGAGFRDRRPGANTVPRHRILSGNTSGEDFPGLQPLL
jgi:hypothetical protein